MSQGYSVHLNMLQLSSGQSNEHYIFSKNSSLTEQRQVEEKEINEIKMKQKKKHVKHRLI